MHINEALAAFREGKFEMDVATIELVQRSGNIQRNYAGPGYVRQEPDGRIITKCYSPASVEQSIGAFARGPAAGELYGDDHHYNCRITDHSAAVWETDPVLVHGDHSLPMETAAVGATLRKLVRRFESRATVWSLRLEFGGQDLRDWRALIGSHKLELELRSLSVSLEIAETDKMLSVEVGSQAELPDNLENCLIQSLGFVLNEDLTPVVSDFSTPHWRTVSLYAGRAEHSSRPNLSPLQHGHPDPGRDVIRLLGQYLDFILADAPVDQQLVHPLSAHLAHARQVSGNSFDAWAVGLSVAVEGVVKLIPFKPPVSDIDFAALANEVTIFLASTGKPQAIVTRVEGLLTGMGSVAVKDRMYALVPSGAVQEEDIRAWSKLRNSNVHTTKLRTADLEDTKVQAQLDLLFKVHRLLHSLVFHLIGYKGRFIDYGRHTFPRSEYPFDRTPSA